MPVSRFGGYKFNLGLAIIALLLPMILLQVGTVPKVYGQFYSGGDFGFSLSSPTQVGCTATYTILYLPTPGFTGSVVESASGVPLATFWKGAFLLSTRMVDTLSVNGLSTGTTYNLTVTANANGLSHSVSTLLVTPSKSSSDSCSNGLIASNNLPVPDFEMAVAPTTTPTSAVGNASVSYLLTYTSINGFAGFVHESVMNAPSGSVWFFSSQRAPSYGSCRVVQSNCEDVLTILTAGLPSGTYAVVVAATATDGSPYHTLSLTITIP